MAHGFNIQAVIKAILGMLLGFFILLIVCRNSKSLYNCLVKLGTTEE